LESIRIKARHDLTPDEVDGLEDRLYEINASRTGYKDAALLGFFAETQGELVGAVAGYTWGGICELRQVWVHEAHRGEGPRVAATGRAPGDVGQR
jgi:N-acetylglutamate synthase-like GNAT family acetyltransferase